MNFQNQAYTNQGQTIELHNYSSNQPIVMGIPVIIQQQADNSYQSYDQETFQTLSDESNQKLLAERQNFVPLNPYPQHDPHYGSQEIIIQQEVPNKPPQNTLEFIIHDVKPTDTLLGISIQYQVSEFRIKQANDLQTEEIYFKKQLKIPNPQANNLSNIAIDPVQAQQDQLAFFFKNKVLKGKDQQMKVARIYLEAADWDIKQAEEDYKEDLEAEEREKKNKKFK